MSKSSIIVSFLLAANSAFAQPQYQPMAIWQREGAEDSSLYGSEILALGDQNSDGFNDWAVFASGWGPPGQICEPRVEFFHGGNPPETVPYMTRLTQISEEEYLWRARALGDLNGDGYQDWAIVVELTADPLGRDVTKVYFGGPGPHDAPDLTLSFPTWVVFQAIGDFNGDGYDDLIGVNSGSPSVVLFGANPMDTLPDWQRHAYLGGTFPGDANGDGYADFLSMAIDDDIDLFLGGEHPDTLPAYHWDEYVSMVAILPDLNGDGVDDLGFGLGGRLEVRWGGSAIHTLPDADLNYPCSSPHTIESAGDFNGDGFHDIAMCTPYCGDAWYGKLTLHLGGSWLNPTPAFVIEGWTEPLNLIGLRAVSNLGDVNGDQIDDLGVGGNHDVPQAGWRGKAVVLEGDTDLIADVPEPQAALPKTIKVTAYPNPFNNSATLELTLPIYSMVADLKIYNLLGQVVFTTSIPATGRRLRFHYDARDLSTGLYFLHVTSGNLTSTLKLMVLR